MPVAAGDGDAEEVLPSAHLHERRRARAPAALRGRDRRRAVLERRPSRGAPASCRGRSRCPSSKLASQRTTTSGMRERLSASTICATGSITYVEEFSSATVKRLAPNEVRAVRVPDERLADERRADGAVEVDRLGRVVDVHERRPGLAGEEARERPVRVAQPEAVARGLLLREDVAAGCRTARCCRSRGSFMKSPSIFAPSAPKRVGVAASMPKREVRAVRMSRLRAAPPPPSRGAGRTGRTWRCRCPRCRP